MGPTDPNAAPPSLNYAIEPDGKIRIPIQDPTEALFIRAHLELPEMERVQESSTWTYGLRLTFHQPDGNFQSQELWLRSGVSPQQDGSPTLEGPIPGRWITDGRVVELNLEGKLRPGGQVEITPLLSLEGSRLLLRLERQPADMQMRLPWDGGAILSGRVSRYSALPWSALSTNEIQAIWRENRIPLSADQLIGKTAPIHRLPPAKDLPEVWTPPTQLAPGQATGLTLQGPCSVMVMAETLSGRAPPKDWAPQATALQGSTEKGVVSQTRVEVPAQSMWFVQWTAPAQGDGLSLRFEAAQHRACLWGQPAGQDWEKVFAPEKRRFTAWSSEKGQSLEVPVATGNAFGVLTVEARPRPPADWLPEDEASDQTPPKTAAAGTIRYTLLTEDGIAIRKGQAKATFEHDPLAHRVEPENGWMGAFSRFSVQHPFQATRLRIESDIPMDFRFLVPLNVEEERSSAYALPGGWIARNAPWDLAPYVSLSPIQADTLLAENRLVRFDATVVPTRRTNQRPEGSQPTHKLSPSSPTQDFPILEHVRKPGVFKPWHRTALGRSTRLQIPPSGSIKLEYRISADEPGPLSLQCGEESTAQELPAVAGSLRLSGLPPGWQFCTLSAPAGHYVVNVPGSGRRWAKREAHALSEAGLIVPVNVPKGGSSVFVRVYTEPGKPAPTLTINLDKGRPRLRTGLVKHPTQATRNVKAQKRTQRARLLDSAPGQLQAHKGILFVLGDDLKPGPHSLQVRLKNASGPVFVRLDSAAGLPEPDGSALRNWYVEGEAQ
jgi:hypothetical protein